MTVRENDKVSYTHRLHELRFLSCEAFKAS